MPADSFIGVFLAIFSIWSRAFPYLDQWEIAPRTIVGTIHLPPMLWSKEMLKSLSRLRSAIVLYQRDIQFFQNAAPHATLRFIPYGVDTMFFVLPHAIAMARNIYYTLVCS